MEKVKIRLKLEITYFLKKISTNITNILLQFVRIKKKKFILLKEDY